MGRRIVIALVVLLVFGVLRLPIESRMEAQLRADRLLYEPPDLSVRERVGFEGFAAVLGGFRSLIASLLDVQNYIHFRDNEFEELDESYHLVTHLQPYQDYYWEMAGWHMAYNASSWARDRSDLRPANRQVLYRKYVKRGLDYFERGVAINPESTRLHIDLGMIHTTTSPHSRDPEPRLAAYHFGEAAKLRSDSPHLERMQAFELVNLSDRESWEKAYEILKRHYDSVERGRVPSAIRDIKVLEERLNIPFPIRIP